MGKTRIPFFLVLGLALRAGAPEPGDPAGGAPPEPKAGASATVTVTAEATRVDTVKTPNPVLVVTAETLARQSPRNLADLLEALLPGQSVSNGGVGTVGAFMPGGARSQDVAVTLDGIRLADPAAFGSANPSTLGMVGIDRVEIQRGVCSSRLGAEAMGGQVALFSATGAPRGLSGTVDLAVGTLDRRQVRASASYGGDRAWVRAAVEGSREAQATETDRDFRNQGVFLSAGLPLSEDGTATVTYRNTWQGIPLPWQSVSPTVRVYDPSRESTCRSEQFIASVRQALRPDLLLEVALGSTSTDRGEPNDMTRGREPMHGTREQAVASLSWDPAQALGLTAGVDSSVEKARIGDYMGSSDRGEGRYEAVSLEVRTEPRPWLRVVGAWRQQWFRQDFVFSAYQGPAASTASRGTGKLGVNILLPGGHRLYANAGTGFGLPFLYAVMYQAQTYLNPGGWSYDPAAYHPLAPERSTGLQAGWSWASGPWSARLDLSRTHFKSLVYFDMSTWVYANGQDIRIQSAEGSLAWRGASWGAEATARSQEARDEGAPRELQFATNAVIRRPFATFGANVWGSVGSWRAEARWSRTGGRYENFGGYPAVMGPDRTHFNDLAAAVRWQLSPSLGLALRGDHLLQRRWSVAEWKAGALAGRNDASQVAGFPAQPRSVTLECRARF